MNKNKFITLEIIKSTEDPQVQGYDIKDIEKLCTPEEYARFGDWFNGQTGAIIEGKFIVYKWDWDRFLQNLPVID